MRYYSTERPIGPGTYPKDRSYKDVVNFPDKTFVEEIGREAYGYLELDGELTEDEVKEWELTPAGMKIYWGVCTSFDDRGKAVSAIVDVKEAMEPPEPTYKSTSRKDIYIDWFDNKEDAAQWVEDARKA